MLSHSTSARKRDVDDKLSILNMCNISEDLLDKWILRENYLCEHVQSLRRSARKMDVDNELGIWICAIPQTICGKSYWEKVNYLNMCNIIALLDNRFIKIYSTCIQHVIFNCFVTRKCWNVIDIIYWYDTFKPISPLN